MKEGAGSPQRFQLLVSIAFMLDIRQAGRQYGHDGGHHDGA